MSHGYKQETACSSCPCLQQHVKPALGSCTRGVCRRPSGSSRLWGEGTQNTNHTHTRTHIHAHTHTHARTHARTTHTHARTTHTHTQSERQNLLNVAWLLGLETTPQSTQATYCMCVVRVAGAGTTHGFTVDTESALRTQLLVNYSSSVRPSSITLIQLSINLLSINFVVRPASS